MYYNISIISALHGVLLRDSSKFRYTVALKLKKYSFNYLRRKRYGGNGFYWYISFMRIAGLENDMSLVHDGDDGNRGSFDIGEACRITMRRLVYLCASDNVFET